jgi:hypothetical protein
VSPVSAVVERRHPSSRPAWFRRRSPALPGHRALQQPLEPAARPAPGLGPRTDCGCSSRASASTSSISSVCYAYGDRNRKVARVRSCSAGGADFAVLGQPKAAAARRPGGWEPISLPLAERTWPACGPAVGGCQCAHCPT